MQDAWRAYLELALGLTEASRKKATKVAKNLLGKGGATAEQLQTLAEELVRTSISNRNALTKVVRYELDRVMGKVGLATSDEVAELTTRVRDLERQLNEAHAEAMPMAVAARVPARKATAKKAPAKKTTAKKTTAKKAAAR